jgi:methionyl-tRNA formyltransferase
MELLNSPKYRSINVHGSLLPKYRGGAPIQRSIMNGDEFTGITIMYMEKGMDSGDILNQRQLKIEEEDNNETVFEKMSYLGRDLLLETLPLLIEGKISPIKQDESLVTYAYNILPGEELLNFNQNARCVFNHIRALSPAPGAHFYLKGEKIKIYSSKMTDLSHNVENGSIINVSKKGFMIACGEGTVLEVLEIQQTGKNKISARDFANGALRKYL